MVGTRTNFQSKNLELSILAPLFLLFLAGDVSAKTELLRACVYRSFVLNDQFVLLLRTIQIQRTSSQALSNVLERLHDHVCQGLALRPARSEKTT